ncbi:hypothetical protein Y032_0258g426 [Ancylostoma ceylanicum]|uniref:Uncharacterized protein n=1 Tax=Ancylostoma ceylanicum TaxID=53326 RepID=A0A016SBG5_9BILA|nr:hypothetical protein Y032_0258g426 [Ancylostoma ceylanicum]
MLCGFTRSWMQILPVREFTNVAISLFTESANENSNVHCIFLERELTEHRLTQKEALLETLCSPDAINQKDLLFTRKRTSMMPRTNQSWSKKHSFVTPHHKVNFKT